MNNFISPIQNAQRVKYNNWIERIQRNFYNFNENKKIDSEEISIKKLEYFD